MSLETQEENAEIIDRIGILFKGHVRKRLLPVADAFLRQYYNQVDAEDLAERKISDLSGAAIAHLNFMENFESGAPKLRVYNPQLASEGWESTHTVIEIINDDMPFLVDSVTMEVNRQSLALHLIIHPVMKTERNAEGELLAILSHDRDAADSAGSESVIHIEVDRQTDSAKLADLEAGMLRILGDVRHAV